MVGVSIDDHRTQCDFAAHQAVPFPLVSDSDHAISKAYDVLRGWPKMDKRVTYVLDEEGIVRGVFHHELRIGKHVDDVLDLLRTMRRPERS